MKDVEWSRLGPRQFAAECKSIYSIDECIGSESTVFASLVTTLGAARFDLLTEERYRGDKHNPSPPQNDPGSPHEMEIATIVCKGQEPYFLKALIVRNSAKRPHNCNCRSTFLTYY